MTITVSARTYSASISMSSSRLSATASLAGGTRMPISPMERTAWRDSSASTPETYSVSSATISRALAALATRGSTPILMDLQLVGSCILQKNCLNSSSKTPGARSTMSATCASTA